MTKQQTVELLQKQLPGFYSVEQVIEIINGIQEPAQAQRDPLYCIDRDPLYCIDKEIEDGIRYAVSNAVDELERKDQIVDLYSAEFELNGNEISLTSVSIETINLIDEITDAVVEEIEKRLVQP